MIAIGRSNWLFAGSLRAGKRAARLDNFDFEELTPEEAANVVPLAKPEV